MPKWKKDATEFTVGVNHHPVRGYQSSIPLPIMEKLGKPSEITFVIKGEKIELIGGSVDTNKSKKGKDRVSKAKA